MDSKHLFDKELLAVFQNNPPIVNVNATNLSETRALTLQMMSAFPKDEKRSVTVKKTIAEIDRSKVPVIIYRPEGGDELKPGILHIHAGGFILGDAQMSENYCRKLATDLDSVIVSVDYRLAPEFPFPAGLEDCYTALRWMDKEADTLQLDASRIAVTGESGGGGLAAQLSFLVRDRKEVAVQFVFLTYPMLDSRTGTEKEPGRFMGQYFWTRESNSYAWKQYLGKDSDHPPYPSVPALIENLESLPKTFIAVGTLDLFATESLEYAKGLAQAGVPIELHLYPGACHGFDYAVGTGLSNSFFDDRRRAFRNALEKVQKNENPPQPSSPGLLG